MAVSYVGVNKEFAGAWQDSGMTDLLSGQGMNSKEINRVMRNASRMHWDPEEQTAKDYIGGMKRLVGGDVSYKNGYGSLFNGTSLEGTISSMHTPTAAERLDNYAQNYDVKDGTYSDAQIKSINRRINKLNGVKNPGSQYTEEMGAMSEQNRIIHAANQRRDAKLNGWNVKEAAPDVLAAEDSIRETIGANSGNSPLEKSGRKFHKQGKMTGRKMDFENWGGGKPSSSAATVQEQIDKVTGVNDSHHTTNEMIAEKMKTRGSVARNNIQSRIDRLQAKMDRVDALDRDALRSGFTQKHLDKVSEEASHFTLKEKMANKLGYVKAAAHNAVDFFAGGNTSGGHIQAHRDSIQTKIGEREINMLRNDRKGILQHSIDNHQKLMSRLEAGDNGVLKAAQTTKGVRQEMARERVAAKTEAAAASKKGWGWKGKAGAVAGLLALGGVIGSQFAGGRKSNAELYNPNPQPQYYS